MKHVCRCDVSHIIPLCHNFSPSLITLMAHETATTKAGKQMKDKEQRMISAPKMTIKSIIMIISKRFFQVVGDKRRFYDDLKSQLLHVTTWEINLNGV